MVPEVVDVASQEAVMAEEVAVVVEAGEEVVEVSTKVHRQKLLVSIKGVSVFCC